MLGRAVPADHFPNKLIAGIAQKFRRFLVDVGAAPVPIHGHEAVGNAFQNIGQALVRFLQARFAVAQGLFRSQPFLHFRLQRSDCRGELLGPLRDAVFQLLVGLAKRGFGAPPVVRQATDQNRTGEQQYRAA